MIEVAEINILTIKQIYLIHSYSSAPQIEEQERHLIFIEHLKTVSISEFFNGQR